MYPLWLSTLCIIAIHFWWVCFLHWPEYTKSHSTLYSPQLAHSSRHVTTHRIRTWLLTFIECLQSHPCSLNPRLTMCEVDTHRISLFWQESPQAGLWRGSLPVEPMLLTTPRDLWPPSGHFTYISSCFFFPKNFTFCIGSSLSTWVMPSSSLCPLQERIRSFSHNASFPSVMTYLRNQCGVSYQVSKTTLLEQLWPWSVPNVSQVRFTTFLCDTVTSAILWMRNVGSRG